MIYTFFTDRLTFATYSAAARAERAPFFAGFALGNQAHSFLDSNRNSHSSCWLFLTVPRRGIREGGAQKRSLWSDLIVTFINDVLVGSPFRIPLRWTVSFTMLQTERVSKWHSLISVSLKPPFGSRILFLILVLICFSNRLRALRGREHTGVQAFIWPAEFVEDGGGARCRRRHLRRGRPGAPYTVLCYTTLYYTMLYDTILYDTIRYDTILYESIICYTVLVDVWCAIHMCNIHVCVIMYYIIIYYTILHYTMLVYTALYYNTLYCITLYDHIL